MKYLQEEQGVRFEQGPKSDSDLLFLLDSLFLLLVSMEEDLQLPELNLQEDGNIQEQKQGQEHSCFGMDH